MSDLSGSSALPEPEFIEVDGGGIKRRIAVRSAGQPSGRILAWRVQFRHEGNKAQALDDWAVAHRRAYVRFDYSGHGESSGSFADGTIGQWHEESLDVFDAFCEGPQIVVGSSMGGWMALLLARALAKRPPRAGLAGLVLIAPAPDFTEELMWKGFSQDIRDEIMTKGAWHRPSDYGDEPIPSPAI
jgi:pimeloyl-ACP methyl ester carboxylesterase